MRTTYNMRRRAPNIRVYVRDDEKLGIIHKPRAANGAAAGAVSGGGSSGDELSDDEFSAYDTDSDDELDSPSPTSATFTSASLPPAKTTNTALPPSSTTAAAAITTKSTDSTTPATTLVTTTKVTTPPVLETSASSSQLPPPEASSSSISSTPPAPTSTAPSVITAIPIVSSSSVPVLVPGKSAITTSSVVDSASSAPAAGASNIPQTDNSQTSPAGEEQTVVRGSSSRAGTIAGATIGSIAAVALIILAIWLWRRRKNRNSTDLTGTPPGEYGGQYNAPAVPTTTRSPSSIMNQLMTAAYATEDGNGYRNSREVFDTYADEKQQQQQQRGFMAHENESMQRLTIPRQSYMRPVSIAARTETTNKTESTWKTWGVLAGSSQPPHKPVHWWVDRYFKSQPM